MLNRLKTKTKCLLLIACLFRRKGRTVVIVRSLMSFLLSWCKNFSEADYSKTIKGINTKLGILAHHDKMQLQDKGIKLKAIVLESCPFLTKIFK